MAEELSRKQEIRVQVEHCCCWGMVPQPVVCCGWAGTPDCRLLAGNWESVSLEQQGAEKEQKLWLSVGVQVDGRCVLQCLPWPSPQCHLVQLFPSFFPSSLFIFLPKRAKARRNILLFLLSSDMPHTE